MRDDGEEGDVGIREGGGKGEIEGRKGRIKRQKGRKREGRGRGR